MKLTRTRKALIATGVLGICVLIASERLVDLAARTPHPAIEARVTRSLEAPEDRNLTPHDDAIANLLRGRPSAAVALLRRAVAADHERVELWIDYSAALYEEGRTRQRVDLFARALAAADRALEIDAAAPAALFNRALALEALGLGPFARPAYEQYLVADAGSEGAVEAEERLRALTRTTRKEQWQEAVQRVERDASGSPEAIEALVDRFPQQARTWAEGIQLTAWAEALQTGDAQRAALALRRCRLVGARLHRRSGERFLLDVVDHVGTIPAEADRLRLADALAGYKEGRILFAKREVIDALPRFSESASVFSRLGSPMALLAAYYAASAKLDAGRVDEASADLDAVLRGAPARYLALRAQVRWEQGTVYGSTRRLAGAAEAYGEAEALFARLGEMEFHARMQHIRARLLTALGRASEAWQLRGAAFAEAAKAGDDALLEFAVSEAAQDALVQKEWDVAHSFFDLVRALPSGNPRRQSDATVWRALASWRGGRQERALREIEEGERSLDTIRDAALRDSAFHDLAFAKALLIEKRAPREALALTGAAIRHARENERLYALPAMLLEQARIQRVLEDLDSATEDLKEAVGIMDRNGSEIERDDLRDSFFSTADVLYEELFDTLIAAGNAEEAFEVAERRRARVLYERVAVVPPLTPVAPIGRVTRGLPSDTVVLHYTVAADRVALFILDDGGYRLHQLDVRAQDLVSQIAAFRRAIRTDDQRRIQGLGAALSEKLIAPAADALATARLLVIVPDRAMESLPFAALRAPGREEYLIEHLPIALAPSANIYIALARRVPADRAGHALIAADPALDGRRLADAAEEGRRIATMYPRRTLLIGNDATLQNVRGSLAESTLVHLAAHTALDERDPGESAILLTPKSDDGKLRLREIASSNLRRAELVVLAGCRTAVRADRSRDMSSLTAAFLAAGAGNVVGTLWDVSDASTRRFSEAFHRGLIAGQPPVDAVHAAQLEMITDSDPDVSKPSAWAAIQLYGPGGERRE